MEGRVRTTTLSLPPSGSSMSRATVPNLDVPNSFFEHPDLPPLSPIRQLRSARDAERKPRSWWRRPRGDDSSQWPERTASIRTTSTADSRSTISSSVSAASPTGLGTASGVDVYRLPTSPREIEDDKEYIGAAMKPVESFPAIPPLNPLGETSDELDQEAMPAPAIPRLVDHHRTVPIMTRSESRLESRAGFRSPEVDPGVPHAEIEMMPRKYQGYWRASFTANIPVSMAMCGCLLLAAGPGPSISPIFKHSDDALEGANSLILALTVATSPATLLKALFAHDFRDALFALKISLSDNTLSQVPGKIASQMYRDISEAADSSKKRSKVWEKVAKLLKKVPQETIVPLMFLAIIGRRLKSRRITVDETDAGVWLMQGLWPAVGNQTSAGDVLSALLLERHDEMPDELPSILQAVNYRFGSGSRCNLMGLLMTKKGSGRGGWDGSAGS